MLGTCTGLGGGRFIREMCGQCRLGEVAISMCMCVDVCMDGHVRMCTKVTSVRVSLRRYCSEEEWVPAKIAMDTCAQKCGCTHEPMRLGVSMCRTDPLILSPLPPTVVLWGDDVGDCHTGPDPISRSGEQRDLRLPVPGKQAEAACGLSGRTVRILMTPPTPSPIPDFTPKTLSTPTWPQPSTTCTEPLRLLRNSREHPSHCPQILIHPRLLSSCPSPNALKYPGPSASPPVCCPELLQTQGSPRRYPQHPSGAYQTLLSHST